MFKNFKRNRARNKCFKLEQRLKELHAKHDLEIVKMENKIEFARLKHEIVKF